MHAKDPDEAADPTLFRTGDRVLASGAYTHLRHIVRSRCVYARNNQQRIVLLEGETFPPMSRCGHDVIWEAEVTSGAAQSFS